MSSSDKKSKDGQEEDNDEEDNEEVEVEEVEEEEEVDGDEAIQSDLFLSGLPSDITTSHTSDPTAGENTQNTIAIPLIHSMETQTDSTVYHVNSMLSDEHMDGIQL